MENTCEQQYTIVEDPGKYYPIEILEVEGITIRGKKIGELDELIFTKTRELGTSRMFNIVYKKSHTRHYMCSQMTIERIIGERAVFKSIPQIGFKRKYKLEQPKRIWACLQYIPRNGAYRTKKGDVTPYKITEVYRLTHCYSDYELLWPEKLCFEWNANETFEALHGVKYDDTNAEHKVKLQQIERILNEEDKSNKKLKLLIDAVKAYEERAKSYLIDAIEIDITMNEIYGYMFANKHKHKLKEFLSNY